MRLAAAGPSFYHGERNLSVHRLQQGLAPSQRLAANGATASGKKTACANAAQLDVSTAGPSLCAGMEADAANEAILLRIAATAIPFAGISGAATNQIGRSAAISIPVSKEIILTGLAIFLRTASV